MKQSVFDNIVDFKNNLDLQLEDLELESNGTNVDLYFDTSDIFQVVLGLEAFYTLSGSFDFNRFNSKQALVYSLLASGWIGEYRLLPPHETELLTQVNLHFGVGIETDPKGRATRFLKELGLTEGEQSTDVSFEDVSKDQLYNFIRKQAGLAETLFKAIQCIIPWHKRLPRLLRQNILIITPSKVHFDEIVQTEHYTRLKQAFEKRRPNTGINNLTDAAAISLLINKVHEYKTGSSKRIPRLLIPSHLFLDVVNESGVQSLLSYESPTGRTSSVLRDCDYYIYKASLRQRRRFTDEDQLVKKASEEYMRVLNAKVTSIIESQKVLTQEVLESIDFYGAPLSQAITDFQMLSFLENVWLKYEAPAEIYQAVSAVVEIAREMSQSKSFQQSVEKAIDGLKAKIGESVYEFKWISSIWSRLERAAEELRLRSVINTFTLPNFFRELGLLRYGFPSSSHLNIRTVLQELLHGGAAEKDARVAVIRACYRGREAPMKNRDSLVMGAAVLLVTRMDSELLWLLNNTKPLPHFSLRILLAEMLFRLNSESERGATLLRKLEKEYVDSATDSDKRSDLAVGIAYLLVRLWRTRGGCASWRVDATNSDNQDELRRLYLERAVTYAQQAYSLIKKDPLKKVYALNQYLFYLVEGGSNQRLNEMKEAAMRLVAFKTDREIWQYRFDDTLARFFYRLATLAESEEDWVNLITEALRCSDEARLKSHGDLEVEHFSTLLRIQRTMGYLGLS